MSCSALLRNSSSSIVVSSSFSRNLHLMSWSPYSLRLPHAYSIPRTFHDWRLDPLYCYESVRIPCQLGLTSDVFPSRYHIVVIPRTSRSLVCVLWLATGASTIVPLLDVLLIHYWTSFSGFQASDCRITSHYCLEHANCVTVNLNCSIRQVM